MIDYKKLKYDDIENWCAEHGQLDWLEAKVAEDVEVEVYPTIVYTDEEGNKRRKQDKSAKPRIESRPISFLLVKEAFVSKFMPEIKPHTKSNKLSMRQRVALRKQMGK